MFKPGKERGENKAVRAQSGRESLTMSVSLGTKEKA